jgi:hypothetical protein
MISEKLRAVEAPKARDRPTILLAGEEDLPRIGRLAASSPSSALDKRRAPPAPIVAELRYDVPSMAARSISRRGALLGKAG